MNEGIENAEVCAGSLVNATNENPVAIVPHAQFVENERTKRNPVSTQQQAYALHTAKILINTRQIQHLNLMMMLIYSPLM